MKFAYSFVFSHSCRCVLVCSFRRLHCPGMGEHSSRKENMELGIPVAEEKWAEVLAM